MKSFGVFMVIVSLAVASGESDTTTISQDTKNAHQANKATSLQTASTHEQIVHAQDFQANVIGNSHNHDKQPQPTHLETAQFYNQESAQFHSQNQGSRQDFPQQLRSQTLAERFSNQHQTFQGQNQAVHPYNQMHQTQQLHNQIKAQQFDDSSQDQHHYDNQAQQYHHQNQQYHDQAQMMPSVSNFPQGQTPSSGFRSTLQNTPVISMTHAQSKEQARDFSSEQPLFASGFANQQDFGDRNYLNTRTNQDQNMFYGTSGQQVFGGTTELKVSAFEKGVQPIHLPGTGHQRSTISVSGLKNLPSLPALVYSSRTVTVPSGQHVLAYSRPWHQGGAYIRQHWQTPHARYVYSHIL